MFYIKISTENESVGIIADRYVARDNAFLIRSPSIGGYQELIHNVMAVDSKVEVSDSNGKFFDTVQYFADAASEADIISVAFPLPQDEVKDKNPEKDSEE